MRDARRCGGGYLIARVEDRGAAERHQPARLCDVISADLVPLVQPRQGLRQPKDRQQRAGRREAEAAHLARVGGMGVIKRDDASGDDVR